MSKPTTTAVKRPRGRPPGSKTKVKPAATWRDSLLLNPGEVLRQLERAKRGNLDQFESETYDVLDAQGLSVGTVVYTETTSMRPPFRTTRWVVQKDIAGNAVVNKQVWL